MKFFSRVIAGVLTAAVLCTCPVWTVRADTDDSSGQGEDDSAVAIYENAVADGAHRYCSDSPSDGNVLINLSGTFASGYQQAWVDQINQYRLEACQNGYPNPQNPSRALTMDDYVPVAWASSLEEMAMLRAAESSLTMYHFTLIPVLAGGSYDFSIWRRDYGLAFGNETIAWSSPVSAWYSERDIWVNQGSGETGHYTSMISPSTRYVGIAGFNGTYVGLYGGVYYEIDPVTRYITGELIPDPTPINTSAYSSQIAEVYGSAVSNIRLTSNGTSNAVYIGSGARLQAVGTITVEARPRYGSFGSHVPTAFDDIQILPSSWGCDNPEILTVDPEGNATAVSLGVANVYCIINGVRYDGTIEVTDRTVDMYRLYNPNSGEHFYTSSAGERDMLIGVGWQYEGIGWVAPEVSRTPVYRLYNRYGGEHHYTTDRSERNYLISLGWSDEGIGWYSDDAHSVPLYRQYNPNAFANNHNYTTSLAENNWLVSLGWQAEDIGWYGVG